jgi:hypothetical protein
MTALPGPSLEAVDDAATVICAAGFADLDPHSQAAVVLTAAMPALRAQMAREIRARAEQEARVLQSSWLWHQLGGQQLMEVINSVGYWIDPAGR